MYKEEDVVFKCIRCNKMLSANQLAIGGYAYKTDKHDNIIEVYCGRGVCVDCETNEDRRLFNGE